MTRMFILLAALLSLFASIAFAASVPGQDIQARATVSYCAQLQVNASACVDFLDQVDAAVQSTSERSTAVIEISKAPISGELAIAFVAPEPAAPSYYTTTSSLFSRPSLVGRLIKLAGRIFYANGTIFLDDGGSVVVADASQPKGVSRVPVSVAIRSDLLSSTPANGAVITVQGVVRCETDGQITLLPFADSSITLFH